MPTQMIQAIRVHQYGGPEQLKLEQIACPKPLAGEVLIRVHAAGVLPIDWKSRQGMFRNIRAMQFPYVPGSAIAGVIEEVGLNVTGFQKGQAVFGRSTKGAYAKYITTSVELLAHKPQTLSFNEAATISGGATTAWQALFYQGELQTGQRMLIHGAAGGVGSFAVQFAKWKGAHVIGTASTANVDFVRYLGADRVVDYTSIPFEQVVQNLDLVLDTVGGETLERSWSVLKRGGALVSLVNHPSQEKAQELGIRAEFSNRLPSSKTLQTIARLIDEGQIKAVIAKTFPLHEAQQAHELSQTGHGRGRIVLHIAD